MWLEFRIGKVGVDCERYVDTGLVSRGLGVVDISWRFECIEIFFRWAVRQICGLHYRVVLSTGRS